MNPTRFPDTDDPTEREQIRELLTANIRRLDERIQEAWTGDLDADAEELQLRRLRTLGNLARQYRLLARDEDVDEMEAELDLIQAAVDAQGGER